MTDLQVLAIDYLVPHPDNPRLRLRDEVVTLIAAEIARSGAFGQEHALLVRPLAGEPDLTTGELMAGRYQVLSGHHRLEAARRAGLAEVPCWVREMDDREAMMQLVLANTQGELSRIEQAVHVYRACHDDEDGGKARGGRGKTGGISEYARRTGQNRQDVSERFRVGALTETCGISRRFQWLSDPDRDCFYHLLEVAKAPEPVRGALVESLAESMRGPKADDSGNRRWWTVKKTAEQCAEVADFAVAEEHRGWLRPDALVRDYLGGGKVKPKTVLALVDAANAVLDEIAKHEFATEDDRREFMGWLIQNSEGESWDYNSIAGYHTNLRRELNERAKNIIEPIVAEAEWETWLPRQEQCDLLLTDPPYSTDVADIETFARTWLPAALGKVKPSGRAYVCVGAYPDELAAYLAVKPPSHLTLAQVLVWTYRNTLGPASKMNYSLNWQAILYYCGTDAAPLNAPAAVEGMLSERFAVQDINAPDGRQGNRFYQWQKPDELAERLIRHSTRHGDLVLDPFAGSGSFILAAARLERRAIGCESNPDVVKIARERGCADET